jgi:4-amino-4-deoxy-L-arabinose transferase-like glycosyltransferase
MSLTFFMTLSLAAFLEAQRPMGSGMGSGMGEHGWMLMAWAAAAAGVLTKGLVAVLIPGAVLILYTALSRDTSPWRRLHPATGLPLFLALSVPWHWLAARRLPDFLDFFFVREHFARYLTPAADREAAWWFFAPVLLAGALPWAGSVLSFLATGWRARSHRPLEAGPLDAGPSAAGPFDAARFLWVWVVFVVVFFSASDSKLIPYVLPALPALALGMAALPAAALRRHLSLSVMLTLLAALILGAASLEWRRLVPPSERSAYLWLLARPLAEVAAILAVSAAFVWVKRGAQPTRGWVFIGAGWCLAVLSLTRAAALVAPMYSGAGLAAAFPAAGRLRPLYSVATYDQSLPFYLRRTVTLVAYRGELDYGLRHDPKAQIAGIDAFLPVWSAESDAFAVMETSMFDDLKRRGVPMRELARDLHRVLVAR